MTRVRTHLNEGAILRLNLPGGMVDDGVRKAAGRVRDRAKINVVSDGLVQTGALAQSISVDHVRTTPRSVTYSVGSGLKYALYQHEGTGPWIYPRRAKVLRFVGTRGYVFAKKVRGVRASHFLTRALRTLRPGDFS